MPPRGPKDYLDLARSGEATTEQLDELSRSTYPFVVAAVASNPRTPWRTLQKLIPQAIASTQDDQILSAMALNPSLSWDDRKKLPGLLIGRLDNGRDHHTSFSTGLALCCRRDMPSEPLLALLNDERTSSVFRQVVARETTRHDLLDVLRADPSETVKAGLRRSAYQAVELPLHVLIDLSDRLDGFEVASIGVGAEDRVAVVLTEPRVSAAEIAPGIPDPRHPVRRVLLSDSNGIRQFDFEPKVHQFEYVQPLSDGGFLIAEARAHGSGTASRNADRYDSAGRLVAQFGIGDAVDHVLADSKDHLWVGYFDEGACGGDIPEACGLARFDAAGEMLWTYSPPKGADRIDDCYALNVGEQASWTYYYSSFDLVRIGHEDDAKRWATSTYGARALASDDRRVVLLGSYDGRGFPRDLCEVWELGREGLERPRPIAFVPATPPGPWGRLNHRVIGRGPLLYFCDGPVVWKADIREVPDPAPSTAGRIERVRNAAMRSQAAAFASALPELPVPWAKLRQVFTLDDGALRDIVITDADTHCWQRAYNYVRSLGVCGVAQVETEVDAYSEPLPNAISDVFMMGRESVLLMKAVLGDIQINCHFFNDPELEMDLDPREIKNAEDALVALRFVRGLAVATGRPVHLTTEGYHRSPWPLTFDLPSTTWILDDLETVQAEPLASGHPVPRELRFAERAKPETGPNDA